MPQYRFEIYNFGQFPAEQQAKMDALVEDGWTIHTAIPNFTELSVLWERDGMPSDKDKPGTRHRASVGSGSDVLDSTADYTDPDSKAGRDTEATEPEQGKNALERPRDESSGSKDDKDSRGSKR